MSNSYQDDVDQTCAVLEIENDHDLALDFENFRATFKKEGRVHAAKSDETGVTFEACGVDCCFVP